MSIVSQKKVDWKDLLKVLVTLAGVAQWIECQPVNWNTAGSNPSQGIWLGCGPGSSWGRVRGNWSMYLLYLSHIDASLPLFLPPFPSL